MPSWTSEQYAAYQARRLPSRPQPEHVVLDDTLGTAPGKEEHPHRIAVCITSFRRRLLDPDNLIGGAKYFVDGLRYAGLIPGDNPEQITLEVSQVKVKTKHEERTEIEITPS